MCDNRAQAAESRAVFELSGGIDWNIDNLYHASGLFYQDSWLLGAVKLGEGFMPGVPILWDNRGLGGKLVRTAGDD